MSDGGDATIARTLTCSNCKREIPEDNFTLHLLYCNRNLRICQLCKEPVAIADMEKHTAQVPCPQCGEIMQACDISAHKTDACSLTQITCSYCELCLARSAMGQHELYCGTRTEKCPDCSELVMIKYKKLHEDSNHGFLKLDDEPGPRPSWKANEPKASKKAEASVTVKHNFNSEQYYPKRSQNDIVKLPFSAINRSSTSSATVNPSSFSTELDNPIKRSPVSRGAIKKRVAPQPPINQDANLKPKQNVAVLKPFKHTRDVPLYKALTREQTQKRELEEENAYRRANNLPLVLNAAEKVDKLRKMSALQNMEFDNDCTKIPKDKLHSKSTKNKKKNISMGESSHTNDEMQIDKPKLKKDVNLKTDKNNKLKCEYFDYSADSDTLIPVDENFLPINNTSYEYAQNENRFNVKPSKTKNKNTSNNFSLDFPPKFVTENNCSTSALKNSKNDKNNINSATSNNSKHNIEYFDYCDNSDTLIPIGNNPANCEPSRPVDRFCDIKNDLRALRKELKECSSPLENRRSISRHSNNVPLSPPVNIRTQSNPTENTPYDLYKITNEPSPELPNLDDDDFYSVLLPCEFCEEMIQANLLVAHETGCRPNITSFASNKNSTVYPTLNENAAPPNTPEGHHAPKLSNININNEKKSNAKNINKIDNNKRSVKVNNVQSSSILSPEEQDDEAAGDLDEVKLPCEFCMTLVPACRLVWHQEACYAT